MLPIEKYYSVKGVSSSSLRYIDPKDGGSPQKYKDFLDGKLDEGFKPHLINGTLVHLCSLEPDKFVVASVPKPTAVLGEVADTMVLQGLELNDENVLNTIRAWKWQDNWGDATVLKKFNEAGGNEYVQFMQDIKNAGKIGMSESTGRVVDACKTSMKMNEKMNYFMEEIDEEDFIESFNEEEIYWTKTVYDAKLKFKSKLDRLILNHQQRTYTLLDVKTTGKPISLFQYSFEDFKYPRQLKFYDVAAKQFLKKKGYGDYTLDKAFIAAVESHGYHTSQLFDVTSYLTRNSVELEGLIKRIAFHYSTAMWTESMESFVGDGIISLKPSKEFFAG